LISKKQKLFECALGNHKYEIPVKGRTYALLCSHCKRVAYYYDKFQLLGYKYVYDNKGHEIMIKLSDGREARTYYTDKNRLIYLKFNDGEERWNIDNTTYGTWRAEKPENWIYQEIFDEIESNLLII